MNPFEQAMKNTIELSLQNKQAGDYIDTDGFLMCGKCHTRKQKDMPMPAEFFGTDNIRRVGILCKCGIERLETERREEERRAFLDYLRRDGITDVAYLKSTFAKDDGRDAIAAGACRRYVDQWEQMRHDNIGILFYGGIGTGKSFLACCIANALLERMVSACVTSFPRILNAMQAADDRQAMLNKLQRYALLVIDDLGAERETSYSTEQIFNVIDARSRSGKPLIVTTNFSIADMEGAQDMAYRRIYDRVLEMCPVRIKLTGGSRRASNAAARQETAGKILNP